MSNGVDKNNKLNQYKIICHYFMGSCPEGYNPESRPNGREILARDDKHIVAHHMWMIPVHDLLFGDGNGRGEARMTHIVRTDRGTFIQDTQRSWRKLTAEEAVAYKPQVDEYYEQARIEHLGDS